MSAATEICHFSVHGDYLTNLFRDIFLEEGYQKVYDIFNQSFCGDIDVKFLNDILECKGKLVGVNDLEYTEDSWDDNPDYKRDYDYKFGGVVYHNKKYFRPYAIVKSWVQADFSYAAAAWDGSPWKEQHYFVPLKRECRFNEVRSYYYVSQYDEDFEVFTDNHNVYIFEELDFDMPYWMCDRFKRSFKAALDEFNKRGYHISIIDPVKELSEAETFIEKSMQKMETEACFKADQEDFVINNKEFRENFAKQFTLQSYKKKILEQNGDDWVDIIYKVDGEEKMLKIPAKPFHQWCIGSGRLLGSENWDENVKKISPWETISPPGIKMVGDNLYHTDWVIGAGLDPEEWYYNVKNDPAFEALDDAVWRYSFNFTLGLKKKDK